MRKPIIAGALAGLAALLGVGLWQMLPPEPETVGGAAIVQVTVPELEGSAEIGARAFAEKCAACHGEAAGGIEGKGPPLVHKIYEPGHHGDIAFLLAARNGARAHHWDFGDMPPVEGITEVEVAAIIAYVRTLQKANGIF
ncbi:cytochrome c [Ostreiculturibacter nitratireducens]|uniref:c-type cytochrome n=1 Tax=Ostreiculturibacter nitratireducens TaxID=3075226 RepID=UPI0031B62C38